MIAKLLLRSRAASEVDRLKRELARFQHGWPPGHFYSPIPALEDVRRREEAIFAIPRELPGIDLNEQGQLALFQALSVYYVDQPFPTHKTRGRRYFFENPNYSYGEAIILYCLMRHVRPRRVIEIGSGYSSCALLDTSELFFGSSIACTCIEPYPELLRSLIRGNDTDRVTILAAAVQDVDAGVFAQLEAGDILFVDSTHVSKVGSDVNHLLFRILPSLNSGVYVHFHDVYYPFEYPREWVYQGRAWNEAYVLRAFLQYNTAFRIAFFNSFFAHVHADRLREAMPLTMRCPGSSLWLTKV